MSAADRTNVLSVPSRLFDALRDHATAVARDPNELAADAIETYLAVQDWHCDHNLRGLRQAEADKFATDEDVRAAFAPRR